MIDLLSYLFFDTVFLAEEMTFRISLPSDIKLFTSF